jgi:hypothetical protein
MESKIIEKVPENVRSFCDHGFQLKQLPVTPQVNMASMQNTSRKTVEYNVNALPGNGSVNKFL